MQDFLLHETEKKKATPSMFHICTVFRKIKQQILKDTEDLKQTQEILSYDPNVIQNNTERNTNIVSSLPGLAWK